MKKITTIFLVLISISLFSQEVKFVIAPSGLIVREAPSKNAKRIAKLENNIQVYIVEKTEISLQIKDDGKIINGNWTKIKNFKNDIKGYVFDGFLTSKTPNKGASNGNYYLTKIDSITLKNYWENFSNNEETKPSLIYLRNNSHTDLTKFAISDFEFYEGTSLTVIKESGLKNIIEVIKIESTYSSCCSNTDEFFYLVDKNKQLVNLPMIENNHCDGPEPYFTYLFPNDKQGKKDKIIYAKVIPKEDSKDTVEVLKIYSWDGVQLLSKK